MSVPRLPCLETTVCSRVLYSLGALRSRPAVRIPEAPPANPRGLCVFGILRERSW
jgi:hypothetical protein